MISLVFLFLDSRPNFLLAFLSECYEEVDAADYRGSVSTTNTGKTCQKWTSQTPHNHTKTPESYPNKGLGDHNFCRNPHGNTYAWCYTTDPDERWETCDIGIQMDNCGRYFVCTV